MNLFLSSISGRENTVIWVSPTYKQWLLVTVHSALIWLWLSWSSFYTLFYYAFFIICIYYIFILYLLITLFPLFCNIQFCFCSVSSSNLWLCQFYDFLIFVWGHLVNSLVKSSVMNRIRRVKQNCLYLVWKIYWAGIYNLFTPLMNTVCRER